MLLGTVLFEGALRLLPLRIARDLLREHYVSGLQRKYAAFCPVHHRVRFIRPNFSFRSRSPNLRLQYTTGAVKIGDCLHGYRLSGVNDDKPLLGLVLGDSHSATLRLHDDEGWAALVSRACGRKFVSLAQDGLGTSAHLRLARIYIPVMKPPLVLLQICGNDPWEDAGELAGMEGFLVARDPEAPGVKHPRLRGTVVPWAAAGQVVREFALARWNRSNPPDGNRQYPREYVRAALQLQFKNIHGIRKIAESSGARLAVISVYGGEDEEALQSFCEQRGIPFLPSVKGFSADLYSRENRFIFDGHLNEKGNRLLAQRIETFLRDHRLLP